MKKLLLKAVVLTAFLSVLLTGCGGTGGQATPLGGGGDDTNNPGNPGVSASDESVIVSDVIPQSARQEAEDGKLGQYGKPYAMGDVLFDDGSATPITSEISLSAEQKAHAIAVIFYVGKGLNSANTESQESRTLGVGLKHSVDKEKWAISTANGYNYVIETIQCTSKTSGGKIVCTGDRNGSDNLAQISRFLKDLQSGGVADDTASAGNYPAFYWAKNYGSTQLSGTDYEDGWYLPTIAELYAVYQCQNYIDTLAAKYEFSEFKKSGRNYWSSTMPDSKTSASYLSFKGTAGRYQTTKGSSNYVCAIREF